MLALINNTLVAAGYPKTEGTIQARLERALAERGKDPGLWPRVAEYIKGRRSSILWLSEGESPAVRNARANEVDQFEVFMAQLLQHLPAED